jgi:phage gp36-like protein
MALPPLPAPEPSSQTYFCTRADIETLWSAADLLAAVDDDLSGTLSSAEEALIDDAILRAATQMIAYLASRYAPETLVGNAWCKQTNAAIAAYFLAIRRGDPAPPQIAELYGLAMQDLRSLRQGAMNLPGASESTDQLPTLTNFTPVLGRDPVIARRQLSW